MGKNRGREHSEAREAAPSLDALCASLGLAPRDVRCFNPARDFDAGSHLLVLPEEFSEARPHISDRYPAGHAARWVDSRGEARTGTVAVLPPDGLAWLLEPLPAEDDPSSFAALRAVMERLRAPGGCPWDAEQTHASLAPYLIEEAYEAVEAIDRGDVDGLREELGDLLSQVLMHAAIAQEQGAFTLEEIVASIHDKMVRRHPHVFGEESIGDVQRQTDRWEELKAEERAAKGDDDVAGALHSVPRALPALQRARAVIGRADRAGLLPGEPPPVRSIQDALRAIDAGDADALGRLLWATVRLARAAGEDAEAALRLETNRRIEAITGGRTGESDTQ